MLYNEYIANYKSNNFFISKNIIDIANDIIRYGIINNASDIHIKDNNGKISLEYRIDGILYNESHLLNNVTSTELIARIKILSGMNVAEKRISQDGSMEYQECDIRTVSIPSITGENIVLRIFNNSRKNNGLQELGFEKEDMLIIKDILNNTTGLILVTGPTGSGKSTTLLSLINILNDGKKKIISIEDPVENKIEGIVQVQVNEIIGMGFSNILRSTLRADPDIIMISEIRDELTANIAIRASLTGHLVLATLHTNDTISTIARLVDMKIPKYLILDSLLCIISQRLIRRGEYSISDNNVYGTSIQKKGRILVKEMIKLDDKIKDIFNNIDYKEDIKRELYKMGFKDIKQDIESKIERGIL